MSSTLQAAKNPEELLAREDPNEPYVWREIFAQSGWLAKRWNKERLKHLKSLDGELRRMLAKGERVHFVTFGQEYSFAESYFLGLWAMLLNRRAIVLTNERVLVLQVNSRRKLMQLKSQVRYGAIAKLAGAWLGQTKLCFAKGRALLFTSVPRADRKALREKLEQLRKAAAPSTAKGREYLCPHCFAALEALAPACPTCRGEFKSPVRAGLLSLVFPGLGDLYLGHHALGAFQIFGAAVVWGLFGTGFVEIANGNGAEPTDPTAAAISLVIVLVMLHVVDAGVTHHTAKKGLYAQTGAGQSVVR